MADGLFDLPVPSGSVTPVQPAPPLYAGFWPRAFAYAVDSGLMMLATGAIYLLALGGELAAGWQYANVPSAWRVEAVLDPLFAWLLPAVITLLFWEYAQATPGKMLISVRIVDASTLRPPAPSQWIIRYLGYFVSLLPLGLGFLWIAFDRRKQGWHDKLAHTVVIYARASDRTRPG